MGDDMGKIPKPQRFTTDDLDLIDDTGNVLPPLPTPAFTELKRDIAERGVVVPIILYPHPRLAGRYTLVDGHHRLRAVKELLQESTPILDIPVSIISTALPEAELRGMARMLNLTRRQLSRAERRGIIADQLRETPSYSDRRIAAMLGVDHKTVASVRRELESTGEIQRFDELEDSIGRRRIRIDFAPSRKRFESRSGELAKKFITSPVSVLRMDAPDWRKRKEYWRSIGLPPKQQLIFESGRSDKWSTGGKTWDAWMSADPYFYAQKLSVEKTLGRQLSSWEFFERYYTPPKHIKSTSIFDPVLCEVAYQWFCPEGGKVLDPFSGWATRGAVAALTGHPYLGIDIVGSTVEENESVWRDVKELAAKYGLYKGIDPVWRVGDSRNINTITDEEYDFIFTCPPFHSLERYSDNPNDLSNIKSYDEFISGYRDILMKCISLLRDNRFIGIVVGEIRGKRGEILGFPNDTSNILRNAGVNIWNKIIVSLPIASAAVRASYSFPRTRKTLNTHLEFIVGFKGDVANIPKMEQRSDQKYVWVIDNS